MSAYRYASGAPARLRRLGSLLSILFVFFVAACGSTGSLVDFLDDDAEVPSDSALTHSLYLIGDAGAPRLEPLEPSLALLRNMMQQEGPNSTVVFLGDNIYPSGLPPTYAADRAMAEKRLLAQIDAVRDVPGQAIFIPGNHDYGDAGMGGNLARLLRQERFVENAFGEDAAFMPDGGFPGPVEVPLNDDVVLVVLNTQWWLEGRKTYGDTGTYDVEQDASVLVELDDIFRRNEGKEIVVVGHHPLYTNGPHGGRDEGNDLGPLTLTRRYLGVPQDLSHPRYKTMRRGLLRVFRQHGRVIYAGGHEHSLQYFPKDDQHYLVSGSGTKANHVDKGRGAAFVSDEKGFARVRFYTDGSVWLDFWKPEGDGETGERLYRRRIREATRPLTPYYPPALADAARPDVIDEPMTEPNPDEMPENGAGMPPTTAESEREPYAFFSQGTVTLPASTRYDTGKLHRLFFGERYRDEWATPVEIPILDLERTAGGLTPIKRGGGFQTTSLHLIGGDGDFYVLRSLDKDPEATVPTYLRRTVAQDIVQDQISAMHPYAAFVLPPLADAAGIYHTSPRLVYVPDDPALGIYRELMGGRLALFESKPDEDQSDEARFGYAENVVGTAKMFEEIREDNDNRVDARAFVRARLFDMWINDWDRHTDQWRWAEFEDEHGEVFRPVPRDRDFAFFNFDGPVARFAKFTGNTKLKRFTNFNEDYGSVYGLNFQGAPLDIRFAASLTRADWISIADSVRAALTDDVIEEAIAMMPGPVYDLSGARIVQVLKERRAILPEIAEKYYELLAKEVDVVGSDKHEQFEVIRHDDGRTEVVVTKIKKDGEEKRELFRRVFFPDETNEVRLYGLGGEDEFLFTGDAKAKILVRAIGGDGEDLFRDTSRDAGENVVYDSKTGNIFEIDDETEVRLDNALAHNDYALRRIEMNKRKPVFAFDYDKDDGLFIGTGLTFQTAGFRKKPFAEQHTIAFNYAPQSSAYNAWYEGYFTQFAGAWDGSLEASVNAIENFDDYHGLGNETVDSRAVRNSYRARIREAEITAALSKTKWRYGRFVFGPTFSYFDLEEPKGLPEDRPPSGFELDDFTDQYYAGLHAAFNIDGTDTLAVTRFGARWLNSVDIRQGVRHTNNTNATLASDFAYFYTSHYGLPLTFALRAGGQHIVGPFEFYQASFLGGNENLRGYRKLRFAGRSSVYQNLEVRLPLFNFNTYLARGNVGTFVFFDNGRVWADGERSSKWHQGYGGGLWISPLHQFVLTGTYGMSEDGPRISLGFGTQF